MRDLTGRPKGAAYGTQTTFCLRALHLVDELKINRPLAPDSICTITPADETADLLTQMYTYLITGTYRRRHSVAPWNPIVEATYH